MSSSGTLFVLTGPTAVGKTDLALRWAEAHQAEIISADSLLFYRGMNIGTAKPTATELARVPHHLIDIVPVNEPLNIAAFVQRAQQAVAEISGRGQPVLVAGGSGFYLKAFFGPVTDAVEVSAEIRQEVQTRWQQEGLPALVKTLRELNPAGLAGLDVDNPRRVTRALERCWASGKPLAQLKQEFVAQRGPFADHSVVAVGLERDDIALRARIQARVELMLAAGLIDEVKSLVDVGLRENPSAARAIGYRETLAVLDGQLAVSALGETIARNTRALVKKQRTWFRTQLPGLRTLPATEAEPDTLFTGG